MRCPQCQHENPGGARFCGECGAPLEARCPGCGAANPPGNKFCHGCGQRLGRPSTTTPPPPSPESYTPRYLAEKILTSRGVLEGERKQVTVLFADLKGSMELLAERDPEEARKILDPVLERMMDAVHRYEGTVNQVMGDGIMALFGAPLAHEDHAVRACYAALTMQDLVKQYADETRRTTGLLLHIRVGLNSGEVVVRSIGNDLHMDYTAVGQTTHLAARMEQMATPGSTLLPPETLKLVEGYVQVNALGPMPVKGLNEPTEVFELTGVGTARSRFQAEAVRGLTKFVGRDTELESLRRTLEQARSSHGQVVALVGEPGVGKSRLVWEFSHSHRTQGWLVLESASVSYGRATSYLPVRDLLKSYCSIEAQDDARRTREKLTGKVLTLDPALQPILPALLALLDVPVDDPGWQVLEPPQRRQRMLDACKRLLLRESQEQPLLLVFEDLHWIDGETQALLDSLVESLPTARILLLVNYRPEYEHAWHRKTYYRELRLDALPTESAEEMLGALLGDNAKLAGLKQLLIERTEGNPFFLEESVRTLVETGALVGERGAHQLGRPWDAVQVPATVQAVLATRIDRLAPEDKRLLQSAAVVGKHVPYPLLQAVTERPEDELRQGLARLQAAEFLYEASLFPDLEYTFKHALTHEVAYGSLLQERRRALHARILGAIESLYPERLVEQVELLAHHAVHGEVWEKAVVYLRQAGQRADSRSAHRDAVRWFEQALATLRHLPRNRTTQEQAIDLHFDLRIVLMALGDYAGTLEHLTDAESIAQALDDQRRLGRVRAYMARGYWLIGDHQPAAEAGELALQIATSSTDSALQVSTRLYLGSAYHALGNYRRAIELLRSNVEALQGDRRQQRFGGTGLPASTSRLWLAWSLAELGEFAEVTALADEAIQIAEAVQHLFTVVIARWGAGHLSLTTGDTLRAISTLEPVQDTYLIHIPLWFPFVASSLGLAYARSGRTAEGIALLEQAVEHAAAATNMMYQPGRMAFLSEGYLLAGRHQDALAMAERALVLARQQSEQGHEAYALRLLGEITARPDPPDGDQAEARYRQALSVAEELGMRPLVAHCHLGLGTLYEKVGNDEQAQGELTTAAEMYRAMEMPFWLEKAEAVLAQVGAA
jgi:class 3 adenylate cyclase/tetratricopeptide (TPR) repeat protein